MSSSVLFGLVCERIHTSVCVCFDGKITGRVDHWGSSIEALCFCVSVLRPVACLSLQWAVI